MSSPEVPPLDAGALVVAVVLFSVAPQLVLRLAVLCWPRSHPRRRELVAEYFEYEIWRRPFWVGDMLVHCLTDGLSVRFAQRRDRLRVGDRDLAYLLPKRCIDVGLSAVTLVMLAPTFIVIAGAVRLADRGPLLVRQTRIGRDGRPFDLLKFRTLRWSDGDRSDASGPTFTPIGRLMRLASLDELPQLINVVRGEMSIVGPRPALPTEVSEFDSELLERHRAKPGITGLWQVAARDDPRFSEYRRLDLKYVRTRNLRLDLAILILTVVGVLRAAWSALRGRR